MRKPVFVVSIFALSLAVSPACATKKFVRTEVGQVNDKVATMGKSLEDTQERVRQAEGKITEVDAKTAAAQNSANQAQEAASAAGQQAVAVGQRADGRSDAIEAANRKIIFEVVLSEDQGKFKFGKTELPAEAQAAIDQMVSGLQNQKSAVWLEIEGHTDNVGQQAVQRGARNEPRRGGEALSLREAPAAAAQDERDQLRRGQARGGEQDS